jgi:hypothetical protein
VDDFALFFVGLLGRTSDWLDDRLPLPWPIIIGLLWPLIATLLNVWTWWMRGTAWKVKCAYPLTTRRRPCRSVTWGEWGRCRHHNRRWQRRTDGHIVESGLRRWETIRGDTVMERKDAVGPSLLRARATHSTLLYYRGFARPPKDVLTALPKWIQLTTTRIRNQWRILTENRLRDTWRLRQSHRNVVGAADGLADRLPVALAASRALLLLLIGVLGTIILAALTDGNWRTTLNYAAAFLFLLSWGVAREGVLHATSSWLRNAVKWAWSTAWPCLVFSVFGGALIALG